MLPFLVHLIVLLNFSDGKRQLSFALACLGLFLVQKLVRQLYTQTSNMPSMC